MKKTISVLLTVILMLSLVLTGSAEASTEKLYNVYGDNMLFQHNAEVILAGTGTPGKTVKAVLFDNSGLKKNSAEGKVKDDGSFSVSFMAPDGGYDEYSIEMTSEGEKFALLKNVVFGELWLSAGQSNMQLEMNCTETGRAMIESGERGSKNVRFLYVPVQAEYNGNRDAIPYEPQKDAIGCKWFDGTDDGIFNISGVAYAFAHKLQEDLDMPVGILSSSVGGSCIAAWIPREYIEKNSELKKSLGSSYITKANWKDDGSVNQLSVATGLYNKKIAPLEYFRPAGMIWYQGESDSGKEHGWYTRAFNVLHTALSEKFGYKDSMMPVVFTALAATLFNESTKDNFQRASAEYAEIRNQMPETRAIISISDLPLVYYMPTGTIHPSDKKPVGERMAQSAEGLVYKKSSVYSAAYLKNAEIRENDLLLTFGNVGEGLKVKGNRIYGFTVCGKDGTYVPADAEIISKDTVRVFSEGVDKPVAAMYSNGLITTRSNLYSTLNGDFLWPVLPSISDWNYSDKPWNDFGWTDCDTEEIWRCETLYTAGYYTIWQGNNAEVSVSEKAAYKGDGGLYINGNGQFSANPIMKFVDYTDNDIIKQFCGFNSDWKKYSTLSVMLKNNRTKPVSLKEIKIYTDDDKYVTPVIFGSQEKGTEIAADGQWHRVDFSLEQLYPDGNRGIFVKTRLCLDDVKNVEFCFEGENASVSMDEISFATTSKAVPVMKSLLFDPFSLLFNAVCYIIGLFKVI